MLSKYKDWIADNVADTYGTCAEITLAMQGAFPKLSRVRGHYYCHTWGERAHWWLMDGDKVVDPTASQFPSKGTGHYEEWVDGTPEPTGLCPNCGEYVYDSGTCCSEACGIAYAAYCRNPY